MVKKILAGLAALALFFFWQLAFCEEKEIAKDNIISIATVTAKGEGIDLEGANIIYDEEGKLWSEKLGTLTVADTSANYGILKEGFLKNYRIVYFDFKEPVKNIWVFIDKDTGDVLKVYKEE